MHCLNLTKYGKLEDGELFDIYLYTKFQGKTHLIMIGEIHLCQPCSLGAARSVFPGTRRTTDNQTSPRTLAKEVAISAKTTSENRTGEWWGGNKQRCIALIVSAQKTMSVQENMTLTLRTYRVHAWIECPMDKRWTRKWQVQWWEGGIQMHPQAIFRLWCTCDIMSKMISRKSRKRGPVRMLGDRQQMERCIWNVHSIDSKGMMSVDPLYATLAPSRHLCPTNAGHEGWSPKREYRVRKEWAHDMEEGKWRSSLFLGLVRVKTSWFWNRRAKLRVESAEFKES